MKFDVITVRVNFANMNGEPGISLIMVKPHITNIFGTKGTTNTAGSLQLGIVSFFDILPNIIKIITS